MIANGEFALLARLEEELAKRQRRSDELIAAVAHA